MKFSAHPLFGCVHASSFSRSRTQTHTRQVGAGGADKVTRSTYADPLSLTLQQTADKWSDAAADGWKLRLLQCVGAA